MFTSSVIVQSPRVYCYFFNCNINLNVAANGEFMLFRVYFCYLMNQSFCKGAGRGGRKVTAMIMLTSSEDVCQSSITFARMNVMARSLYEENTRIEEVSRTNCCATVYRHETGNIDCATHICV